MRNPLIFAIILFLLLPACGRRPGRFARTRHYEEVGIASWYGWRMKGYKTASGERYNPKKLTAAHRKLPFGTIVKVTNLENDRSVRVRVNDRGPAASTKRVIDLSMAAAKELGFVKEGTAKVKVESN